MWSTRGTDNSTAATHRITKGKTVPLQDGERPFNDEYLAMMRHFEMKPRTTEVGEKEQNGDVEASNGALKRTLQQALLLRGCRDFDTVDAWQDLIDTVVRKSNTGRCRRVAEELATMRELEVTRLPDFAEEDAVDIGYVQQSREEIEVLFTFLADRYDRRSVMITSNCAFRPW